ncbi:hypothetical protein LWI28_020050 [Acer negundo]|uniref:Zinc knuckle CX2CX4HX4C domain-containing protein n=1 Tax=Acer negundo TaxID=4023 RepID=A0AAD5IWS8_ACENE|nr:hypothetical protein LWI28_020050 [Acer negundo]
MLRGIGVPLRLDKATSDGDFGYYARVLVDVDVSSVLPTSVLLERDEFHNSFIAVEYENLLAFCSICSSIGHWPSSCRWNKSSKDVGGHDSVVVHTLVGSNLISSSTSSAGLVLSSNPSSSTVSTISEMASSSVPPMISQAIQISNDSGFDDAVTDSVLVSSSSVVSSDSSLQDGSGFSCSSVMDSKMQIESSGPWSASQAELRLIVDSSWAS